MHVCICIYSLCWIWGLNSAILNSNMWWHSCKVVNRDVLMLFAVHICHKPEQDPLSFFQLTLKRRSLYRNMLFEWLNDSRDVQLSKLRNHLNIIMQVTSCSDRQTKGWKAKWKQCTCPCQSKSRFAEMKICSLVLLFEFDHLALTWEQFH